MTPGRVYLVGAGPGAPDLLTLRAAEVMKRADVVFYDALIHGDTLALAGGAKKIAVGKRCGSISTDQRFINRALVEAALKYETVVRLKGGDPMLFGRAQEEIEALRRSGIAYEIIPGVTAALAGAAQLRVPLTQRGSSRSVVLTTARVGTGEAHSEWTRCVRAADVSAIYMAAGQLREIALSLQAEGIPGSTPVAIVENISLPNCRERRTTLAGLVQAELPAGPAMLYLGEVLRQRRPQDNAVQEGALAPAVAAGKR